MTKIYKTAYSPDAFKPKQKDYKYCHPSVHCPNCKAWWAAMEDRGLWKDGDWTAKARAMWGETE